MADLASVFEILAEAGFKLHSIDGIQWFELVWPTGKAMIIKERVLLDIIESLGEDPLVVARFFNDPAVLDALQKKEGKLREV